MGMTSYANFPEAPRFRKTGAMSQMFFVYNSGSNHSIFILIVALESVGLSLSTAKKAAEIGSMKINQFFYKRQRVK